MIVSLISSLIPPRFVRLCVCVSVKHVGQRRHFPQLPGSPTDSYPSVPRAASPPPALRHADIDSFQWMNQPGALIAESSFILSVLRKPQSLPYGRGPHVLLSRRREGGRVPARSLASSRRLCRLRVTTPLVRPNPSANKLS